MSKREELNLNSDFVFAYCHLAAFVNLCKHYAIFSTH